MDVLHAVLLILIGMGAGFVQRVSGFGLGIFAMMFMPHFLPTHTAAAAISSLFSSMTSTYNAVKYRKNVAYRTAIPMICAALISIPVAVRFSKAVTGGIFTILLGSVLILLRLYFLFIRKNVSKKPTARNGILAGAIGGTLNGLFSTGGPPAVLYLSSATSDNITYFATIQFYFCFTNLYSTIVRAINGIITPRVLIWAGIGMIGCMIGDWLGAKVFHRLDSERLKRLIYIGMLISGVVLLF
ncbi:MAG: sulfite exporter TauE/SafE family protein [Christensenellaceae bacterium]|nr:sulfite exporter TauE/SafE family protein [Christensenellaceae bacterium]